MLRNLIHGILIGTANIIPGVSGGTVAVIVGIYDKLITSISHIMSNPFKEWDSVKFLAVIFAGAGIGVIAFSSSINYLMTEYPSPTFLFFIGLILGSIPAIYNNEHNMDLTTGKLASFLVMLCIMISIALIPGTEEIPVDTTFEPTSTFGVIYLFLSGFIAAATMIIPGLSGSFILLLIGSYQLIIHSVATFNITVLVLVAIGALTGIFSASKGIEYILKQKPAHTHYAILGLLLGSVVKLWPEWSLNITGIIGLIALLVGAFIANRLEKI